MPNGHMPSWEEWSQQLSEEQRQYSMFKILQTMDERFVLMTEHCPVQLERCEARFKEIEDIQKNRKWIDKGLATLGGIIGGALSFIGIKLS